MATRRPSQRADRARTAAPPPESSPAGGVPGLEFRHLRAFAALAEELHYGRAAERLAITQPPLSLAIQQLEDRVGARLFDRGPRGVGLTAAGTAFRPEAERLLAGAEQACRVAREVQAGLAGRLRIGFVGSMVYRGLPQWLTAFATEHPGVRVELQELNSQQQIEALRREALDLGFVHTRHAPPELQAEAVHAEPFVACLPEGHRLVRPAGGGAGRTTSMSAVDLARLKGDPLVIFSAELAPDYHRRILDLCAAQGFHPERFHEVRHWLSVVALVGQGMGVSVVPASLAQAGLRGVCFRPLKPPGAQSELHALWRPQSPSPVRDRFLGMVREAAAATAAAGRRAG